MIHCTLHPGTAPEWFSGTKGGTDKRRDRSDNCSLHQSGVAAAKAIDSLFHIANPYCSVLNQLS